MKISVRGAEEGIYEIFHNPTKRKTCEIPQNSSKKCKRMFVVSCQQSDFSIYVAMCPEVKFDKEHALYNV